MKTVCGHCSPGSKTLPYAPHTTPPPHRLVCNPSRAPARMLACTRKRNAAFERRTSAGACPSSAYAASDQIQMAELLQASTSPRLLQPQPATLGGAEVIRNVLPHSPGCSLRMHTKVYATTYPEHHLSQGHAFWLVTPLPHTWWQRMHHEPQARMCQPQSATPSRPVRCMPNLSPKPR